MIRSQALSRSVAAILWVTTLACSQDPVSENEASALILESLEAGSVTTCGLTAEQELYCWGDRMGTIVPVDSTANCPSFTACYPRPTLVPTGLEFRQISMDVGFFPGHICGLTAGEVFCWGKMLVTSDFSISVGSNPTRVTLATSIEAVTTGMTHDCALATSGDIYCWGDYDFNVRGTGGPVEHDWNLIPNLVVGGWAFKGLATGIWHSCGLATNGEALCWGRPSQVGMLDPPIRNGGCGLPVSCVDHPVRADGGRQFRQLEAGVVTCGIDGQERLYCWGFNGTGAVGDGSTIDRIEPVQIDVPGGVTTIAVGLRYTCAISTREVTYCWGANGNSRLGTGRPEQILASPTAVLTPAPLLSLAVGSSHTCGLDASGAAWCWGLNSFGQLGTGDTTRSPVPTRVVSSDT